MKVETKKIETGKVELNIEVPSEQVKKKFDEIYQRIGKEAKIPGFRQGKAPRDILEKHHSRLAEEELIKDLIPLAYKDSLASQNVDAIDLPQISDIKLGSGILSFKAMVELRPEIELKNYKNIKLKRKKTTVSDADVSQVLKQLQDGHKAQALDDKFAKRLGYKTFEEMRSSIEKQLFVQKENESRHKLQEELIKDILDRVKFRLPQSLVRKQLEELVYQAGQQLAKRGAAKEQIDSQEDKLRQELKPQAENQVKTYLVLEEIARKENIGESGNLIKDVIEFLLSEAEWIEE